MTKIHVEAMMALQLVNDLPTEEERDRALLVLRELLERARERRRARPN